MLKIGEKAPDFCLAGDIGQVCLKDLKGKWVVVYFYPKDMTSGCTIEALEFTELKADFETENAVILGISADSIQSHAKFREKQNLKHTLLSDIDKKILEAYGVWQTKKMYGKEFKGIIRSTYLIDDKGNIANIWAKVSPAGHAEEVLTKIKELSRQ